MRTNDQGAEVRELTADYADNTDNTDRPEFGPGIFFPEPVGRGHPCHPRNPRLRKMSMFTHRFCGDANNDD